MGKRRNILVVRQDRIGDAVLATALPRELKRQWPDCRVTMMVRGYTAPLFQNNPHVDEILTDDYVEATRGGSFWNRVGQLRRRRFTHALMLLPQARINYMTFCAGIPVRVGHGVILFHALTGVRPVMTRKFNKGRHEAAYSLDLARAIGVQGDDYTPEIHLAAGEQARRQGLRETWGAPARRLVGVHSTSGKSAPNWTAAVWAELVRLLAADPSVQVVVTDNAVPPELRDVPGVLYPNVDVGLRRALVNLSALDVLVSASTGPMHMAAALKVPTLSLFCPLASCAPELWGPLGNAAEVILPEPAYCRDRCPGDPHICDYAGATEVTPAQVAARLRSDA